MLEPEKRQREFSDRDLSYPPLPPAGPPPARPASLPPDPAPRLQTPTPAQSPAAPWKSAEVVGRVGNRFCLLETEDGLVIMDPAAARERILFERAKEAMDKQTVASQKLLVPETVACGPMEARRIGDHLESYRALGFELEPFGGDTFMVEAMPAWMGDVDPAATLKTLAEQIDPSSARIAPEKLRDSLARSCCLIAARRQTGHGPAELRALIDALARCRMPYTTPHGRPTLIHMGFNELKRKFGIEG